MIPLTPFRCLASRCFTAVRAVFAGMRLLLRVAMLMRAASAGLRFVRFGGVSAGILREAGAGFLLHVWSKVTEASSRARPMQPAAAWLPAFVGGFAGVVVWYLEDGRWPA